MSNQWVVQNAAKLWGGEYRPYSMEDVDWNTGYRQDCSGYVSMCIGAPKPGLTTATLVTEGWIREIPWEDLQAGDFIGVCGPGSEGAYGHIQIFTGDYMKYGGPIVWEQAGDMWAGPEMRPSYYTPGSVSAYRLTNRYFENEDDMSDPWAATLTNTATGVSASAGHLLVRIHDLLARLPEGPLRRDTVLTDGNSGENRCVEDLLLTLDKRLTAIEVKLGEPS